MYSIRKEDPGPRVIFRCPQIESWSTPPPTGPEGPCPGSASLEENQDRPQLKYLSSRELNIYLGRVGVGVGVRGHYRSTQQCEPIAAQHFCVHPNCEADQKGFKVLSRV